MKRSFLPSFELPPTADFHCHLRQGKMMELCAPLVRDGGCDLAYVMPNLQPPIYHVSEAISYHKKLSALAPSVSFLMTLFLHAGLTPAIINEAAQSKIIHGVKYYPAGVTTNSRDGVLDIEQFYPIFEAMQLHDLVLNLHGEAISSAQKDLVGNDGTAAVTVLNAEPMFLPQLEKLHRAFPKLRIVLEHVSTMDGLAAVRRCGPTVAGTITAHHLWLTIDDWCTDVHSFCKPVAKLNWDFRETPSDRIALVKAVLDGSGKFFFGSDSAPHPAQSKKGTGSTPAGCFTQPWCSALVVGALEEGIQQGWVDKDDVTKEAIESFLSGYGRSFYRVPRKVSSETTGIRLENKGETIPAIVRSEDGEIEVVPFGSGKPILSLSWK